MTLFAYKIETPWGWLCLPEKIGQYRFPLSLSHSFQDATLFLSKRAAIKTRDNLCRKGSIIAVIRTNDGCHLASEEEIK